ncbi:MAG: hypothetical protein AB7P40_21535 [Chloroflexota bacterium]
MASTFIAAPGDAAAAGDAETDAGDADTAAGDALTTGDAAVDGDADVAGEATAAGFVAAAVGALGADVGVGGVAAPQAAVNTTTLARVAPRASRARRDNLDTENAGNMKQILLT